jgi:hypothetical protein
MLRGVDYRKLNLLLLHSPLSLHPTGLPSLFIKGEALLERTRKWLGQLSSLLEG